MEAVIVTGLSGAGKSNAMNYLEDMGYYCIDNMPPALLQSFITLEKQNRINMDKAAFVMDIRGREFFGDLVRVLEELKGAGKNVRVLFLEATDDALVRRFKETRRVHPLAEESGTNSEAIRRERELLKGVRENADLIINTTGLKPADLQNLLQTMLSGKEESDTFSITVQSFGYKHGMTMDADMVFDARFIPNPYYLKSMKNPGLCDEVSGDAGFHPEGGGSHPGTDPVLYQAGKEDAGHRFRVHRWTAPVSGHGKSVLGDLQRAGL